MFSINLPSIRLKMAICLPTIRYMFYATFLACDVFQILVEQTLMLTASIKLNDLMTRISMDRSLGVSPTRKSFRSLPFVRSWLRPVCLPSGFRSQKLFLAFPVFLLVRRGVPFPVRRAFLWLIEVTPK